MKTAYAIYIENEFGERKYFKNNESFLNSNIKLSLEDAKLFFEIDHALINIKTFKSTNISNKAPSGSGFENQFDRFMSEHSNYSGPKIHEIDCEEIYFTIKIKEMWLHNFDEESFEVSEFTNESMKFYSYDDVKKFCKESYKKNWFTNSQVFVKHNFVR